MASKWRVWLRENRGDRFTFLVDDIVMRSALPGLVFLKNARVENGDTGCGVLIPLSEFLYADTLVPDEDETA